jgi:hypothetical protein
MRFRTTTFLGIGLVWLSLAGGDGRTQEAQPQPTEYQIKAAFIFNFARFVEWPPQAFNGAKSPFIIGILGDNPFHDDLEQTVRDKTVDDHPFVVKEFRSPADATNCHILFISTSEKPRLAQILKYLRGASVLTVGEMDRFTESGGMINFIVEGTKIRFRINKEAATNAGLKISSKLLNLALRPRG